MWWDLRYSKLSVTHILDIQENVVIRSARGKWYQRLHALRIASWWLSSDFILSDSWELHRVSMDAQRRILNGSGAPQLILFCCSVTNFKRYKAYFRPKFHILLDIPTFVDHFGPFSTSLNLWASCSNHVDLLIFLWSFADIFMIFHSHHYTFFCKTSWL